MKIDEKFDRLKQATARNLAEDTLGLKMLELQLLEPDELIQTGYVDRAIDYVLDGEVMPEDIEEFFETKCASIPMSEMYRTGRPLVNESTAGSYIYSVKYDMIRWYLLDQYTDFLNEEKKKNKKGGLAL